MHFEFSFPKGVRPYLITLRKDLRSPFQPESALLHAAKRREEAGGEAGRQAAGTPEPVEIDLDGITDRIVAFPVPEGRYGRVFGTPNGALFTALPIEGYALVVCRHEAEIQRRSGVVRLRKAQAGAYCR